MEDNLDNLIELLNTQQIEKQESKQKKVEHNQS